MNRVIFYHVFGLAAKKGIDAGRNPVFNHIRENFRNIVASAINVWEDMQHKLSRKGYVNS